jgi:GNAT superfamily N-acetyltransferase
MIGLSEPLQIRPATERDVPLILEFIRDLAAYEKLLERVEVSEARLQESLFGTKRVASCVLAYQRERPVAFALYYFTYSTFAGLPGLYLEDLFVKPEFRGHGIGRALLRHLAKLARDEGCWRIEWAVLHWNKPAIGFYESLGAMPMDEWAVYRLSGAELNKLADEEPRLS